MAWFRKEKKPLKAEDRRDLPPDVFQKCTGCSEILYREKLAENEQVIASIPKVAGLYDFTGLSEAVVKLKRKHPDWEDSELLKEAARRFIGEAAGVL